MTEQTQYRLHEVIYFDLAGRAEPIRICLHMAGLVNWKDTRIEGSTWPTMRPTTPLGCLPLLKISAGPTDNADDTTTGTTFTHCQSMALDRYAAKLAGLYPTDDPLQALYVDEVMDTLSEMISSDKLPRSDDREELQRLRQDYQHTVMTKYCTFVESIIQSNGGGTGVATSPSVADLIIMCMVQMIQSGFWEFIDGNFFDAYPGILATVDTISNHDGVKSYYSDRSAK